MVDARCPICQGERFYQTKFSSRGPFVKVGFFFSASVHCLVCLGCGFLAPCVDDGGLAIFRAKARKKGMSLEERPIKRAWREV